MNFVVAGIVLLLTFLVGVFSYVIIPYFDLKNIEEKDVIEYKATTAMTKTTFFRIDNWRKWIIVSSASLLCAVVTWILLNSGIGWVDICKYVLVAVVLIAVMIIDWKLHIIPNIIVVGLFVGGVFLLIIEFFVYRETFGNTLLLRIISLAFCLVLFYALARLTKEGMGMGDVKLIAVLGWMLGFSTTIVVVLFALLICAGFSVVLLTGKKKNKDDTIPFGPFLFFGYILMLIILGI